MSGPTFKVATDALGLSGPVLARIFDRPAQSIRQMRLDPSHPSYRPPPEGWRSVLAGIARERKGEIESLAAELESESR